jgi:hypothetical protein
MTTKDCLRKIWPDLSLLLTMCIVTVLIVPTWKSLITGIQVWVGVQALFQGAVILRSEDSLIIRVLGFLIALFTSLVGQLWIYLLPSCVLLAYLSYFRVDVDQMFVQDGNLIYPLEKIRIIRLLGDSDATILHRETRLLPTFCQITPLKDNGASKFFDVERTVCLDFERIRKMKLRKLDVKTLRDATDEAMNNTLKNIIQTATQFGVSMTGVHTFEFMTGDIPVDGKIRVLSTCHYVNRPYEIANR